MIKLIILDVDGTMTNGGITYDENGLESKTFNVKDGFAIVNSIRSVGMKFAIITGRESKLVQSRAKELKIDYCFQKVKDKKAKIEEILKDENLTYENIAAIGDDLNDYSMIKAAKLGFCPADASDLIANMADVKLSKKGGEGAVAQMVEYILKQQNQLEDYVDIWKK